MTTPRVQITATSTGLVARNVGTMLADNALTVHANVSAGLWSVEIRDAHGDVWRGCRPRVNGAHEARAMVRELARAIGRVQ